MGDLCINWFTSSASLTLTIQVERIAETKSYQRIQRKHTRLGQRGTPEKAHGYQRRVFDDNASDYGRKLYLIENCIYGVDIQPIAVQIAKLRFYLFLLTSILTLKRKPRHPSPCQTLKQNLLL